MSETATTEHPRCNVLLNGKVRCLLNEGHPILGKEHKYDPDEIRQAFPKWSEEFVAQASRQSVPVPPTEQSAPPAQRKHCHRCGHDIYRQRNGVCRVQIWNDMTHEFVRDCGCVAPFHNEQPSDPSRFVERSFTFMENAGHSIRLINREHQGAISIPWQDLSALRELITLALGDEPAVRASSPEAAQRLATREDAERFIRDHLGSAQWHGEQLMITFEKEALIHALVEQWTFPMEPETPAAQVAERAEGVK